MQTNHGKTLVKDDLKLTNALVVVLLKQACRQHQVRFEELQLEAGSMLDNASDRCALTSAHRSCKANHPQIVSLHTGNG